MIRLDNISLRAGDLHLEGVCLEVPAGAYGVLMGKTGSGKTTLVEAICGLRGVDAGRIELAGRDVTDLRPAERNIGYVPQDAALFPKMTVRRHLGFPLVVRRQTRSEIERRTEQLAELLSIGPLLDRSIDGLSGGEIQRVAVGRALAFHPQTLILDESLSALDDETRGQMYLLLKNVQRETGVTALHITHNREEARQLADRLYVLREGQVVGIAGLDARQLGPSEESHFA